MKEWFANLATRERLIVAVGGAAALLILFWALVWLPLERGQEELRTSVSDWRQSLSELRVLAASMALDESEAVSVPVGDAGQSPVVVVDQTLRERNLNSAVKRRQPTPNGIRIEFENVAFDELVVWLGELSAAHGLSVQAGSLSQGTRDEEGRINASLTLERSL